MVEIGEPVIASSNRYLDIEPYVQGLFAEDPVKWMDVMPWEFPQHASRHQEESFLRQYFSDREIRMQGGATGRGNGFRFLKQVWYSAAMWNSHHRIPAIADEWFENHQDVINDPTMITYFFRQDAQTTTFFQDREFNMYTPKVLHWAMSEIQRRLLEHFGPQVAFNAPADDEGRFEDADESAEAQAVDSAPIQAVDTTQVQATETTQDPAVDTTQTQAAETTMTPAAINTEEVQTADPTEVQAAETAQAKVADATETQGADTAETQVANTTHTEAADGVETQAAAITQAEDNTQAPEATATTQPDAADAAQAQAAVTSQAQAVQEIKEVTESTSQQSASATAEEDVATSEAADQDAPASKPAEQDEATVAADATPAAQPSDTPAESTKTSVGPGQEQGTRNRNFSSGSHATDERSQQHRRGRGSCGNKRHSFNQTRSGPRPPYMGDTRHTSNPYSTYGGQPGQMSPYQPGSMPMVNRMPSGGPFPSPVEGMPPLPQGQMYQGQQYQGQQYQGQQYQGQQYQGQQYQGQQYQGQQYQGFQGQQSHGQQFPGQQFHGPPHPDPALNSPMQANYAQPMHHMQQQQPMYIPAGSHVPVPMPPGGVPNAYIPPPFSDRSNVHPDTRNFGYEQPSFPMQDRPEYHNKRRDSTQTRANKARGGYGGSMRGRGNRGRGSFDAQGQFSDRTAPNDADVAQREANWRRSDWQGHGQAGSHLQHGGPEYGVSGQSQVPPQGNVVAGSNSNGQSHMRANPREAPVCVAGCTREVISDACRTAYKLIVFNVPPELDEKDITQYFASFGDVKYVSPPKLSLKPAAGPAYTPRYHLWVTFANPLAARRCLAGKGAQWPGGVLLLEVPREHWDPNHFSHLPNQGKPMASSDAPSISAPHSQPLPPLTSQESDSAPPSAQAAAHIADSAPNTSDSNMPKSADVSNAPTMRDTTPTTSSASTPKTKKQSKNKKGKAKKDNGSAQKTSDEETTEGESHQGDSGKEEAEKSGPLPSSSAADSEKKISEADVQDVSEAAAEVSGKMYAEAGEAAEAGDKTPTAPVSEPVSTGEDATANTPKPDDGKSGSDRPPATAKQDDDAGDESFHTASGSPGADMEPALEGNEVTAPSTPIPTEPQSTEQSKDSPSASDVGSARGSDSALSKTSAKSLTASKDTKKAPIPQVPSQRSASAAVASVDTDIPKTFGMDQSESLLQVPAQRPTSGSTEAATPTFVTAPNTPAIPEPAEEPRSKKSTIKQKGPEQTESLSVFGRSKQKRKPSKANPKKGESKRKGSTNPIASSSKSVEEGSTDVPSAQDDQGSAGQQDDTKPQQDETEPQQDIHNDFQSRDLPGDLQENQTEAQSKDESNDQRKQEPEGQSETLDPDVKQQEEPATSAVTITPEDIVKEPTGGSESKYEPGMKAKGKIPVRDTEPTPPAPLDDSGSDTDDQKPGGGGDFTGLGITTPQPGTGAKKKNNKNKNKNRKNKKKAQVKVTEMSHPGVDDHTSKSSYEFKGNDVDSNASQTTDDTVPASQDPAAPNMPATDATTATTATTAAAGMTKPTSGPSTPDTADRKDEKPPEESPGARQHLSSVDPDTSDSLNRLSALAATPADVEGASETVEASEAQAEEDNATVVNGKRFAEIDKRQKEIKEANETKGKQEDTQ